MQRFLSKYSYNVGEIELLIYREALLLPSPRSPVFWMYSLYEAKSFFKKTKVSLQLKKTEKNQNDKNIWV